MSKRLGALGLVIVSVFVGAAPAPTPTPTKTAATPTPPRARPSAVAGKAIYEANCAPCHGISNKGDGPAGAALSPKPANFTELENMKNKSNQKLFNVVTDGKPPMSSFKQLSEDDRWNVVDHIRTFSATLFP